MPIVPHDQLTQIATNLLKSAGASQAEAEIVAKHSIGANLAGHDSHGIIQVPTYIERIQRGHIVPGADMKVVNDSPTTTVVDGNWGFGYVVSEWAMRTTVKKAKQTNMAAATVFRQSHVGRVADYPIMAAKEGMIGIMTADSGRSAKGVVPFGGRKSRLGTNPICIAMPSNLDGPVFVDMATSAVAAGKVKLAQARGTSIPEGWIVDAQGNPTTDPSDFDQGGSLLPLGGPEGHKGYGLSVMIEIFSGLLTGLGFGHDPSGRHNDGCFMAAFNVSAFRPLDQFKKDVTDLMSYIKSAEPAEGFDEILYPGEMEHRQTQRRMNDGIEVEETTWLKLSNLAQRYGVAKELGLE